MDKKTVAFTPEEIKFLEEIDGPNAAIPMSQTIQHGYIRQLDQTGKEGFEKIYKNHIDPKFVVCYHCGNEIFAMVERVFKEYAKYKATTEKAAPKAAPVVPAVEVGKTDKGEAIVEEVRIGKPAAKKVASKKHK